MKGDLSNFKNNIKNTMSNILKSYTPEIEIALGPAKLTFRAVPNKIREIENDGLEQEL